MTAIIAFAGFILCIAGVSEMSVAEPLTWWKVGVAVFGVCLVWAAGWKERRVW